MGGFREGGDEVFPARAGMILGLLTPMACRCRIPRESGDDPEEGRLEDKRLKYSPRERG